MKNRFALLSALGCAAAVLAVVGCQTYDFQPVTPRALSQETISSDFYVHPFKADVMLVVDKSGSMNLPLNPADPACASDATTCGIKSGRDRTPVCPASCTTRWREVQSALGDFLAEGSLARFGLTFFPQPTEADACHPGDSVATDVPQSANDSDADLNASASDATSKLLAVSESAEGYQGGTGGGTPTGDTFAFLQGYPEFSAAQAIGRPHFVLLITDGVPNCNPENPHAYDEANPGVCECTYADPRNCVSAVHTGCLDIDETVGKISGLTDGGTQTIVIGFGAELTGSDAGFALQQMALAGQLAGDGGFARRCPMDAGVALACGTGDPCDVPTKTCQRQYYLASNRADLATALRQTIPDIDPCQIVLRHGPDNGQTLSVVFDGTNLVAGPDTFTYQPPQTVQFVGQYCDVIKASTPDHPVHLTIKAVQSL